MMRKRGDMIAVAVSMLLLCGAAADRISLISPVDPAPYHARVREVAARAPLAFGNWVGEDIAVPPEARSQLHPNVIISRGYHNTVTNQSVTLLLVQCPDVRDLVPHYPPVCYPGRGLSLDSARPVDWRVPELDVTGTEYQFESNTFETDKLTIVDNFMVLPDGRICREMNQVRRQVGLRTRYFGAAQVQVVFSSDTPAGAREKICDEFIEAYRPLLDAIRSGVRS